MKPRSCLLESLIIGLMGLAVGGLALLIANMLIGNYDPPWVHYTLPTTPQSAVSILHVAIRSSLEDPTGDIIYIATKDGTVYGNSLFQQSWLSVAPSPDWNNTGISKCATVWDDHPPVGGGVIDSAGVRFERPISTILRCYVLMDDGSIQVWVHSANGMDLFKNISSKMGVGAFGGILGIAAGVLIIILRRRKPAEAEF